MSGAAAKAVAFVNLNLVWVEPVRQIWPDHGPALLPIVNNRVAALYQKRPPGAGALADAAECRKFHRFLKIGAGFWPKAENVPASPNAIVTASAASAAVSAGSGCQT